MAAEIWISLVPPTTRDADTMPLETVPGSSPSGFETTVISSPSLASSLVPKRSVAGGWPPTSSITTSLAVSDAATEQRLVWPSDSSTEHAAAPCSTCAAATTDPPATKQPSPLPTPPPPPPTPSTLTPASLTDGI